MNIDPSLLLRLQHANQSHLVSYWDQLDCEERAILLRDISNVDFDHITHAFEGIKDQLVEKSSENDEHAKHETIDQLMEPIPEHLTASMDQISKEQLEHYRREGQLNFLHNASNVYF